MTLWADKNQCICETTWGHAGYGKAGAGITAHLMNKKVSIVMDAGRPRPRAYMHRHKQYKEMYASKKDLSRNGSFEMIQRRW